MWIIQKTIITFQSHNYLIANHTLWVFCFTFQKNHTSKLNKIWNWQELNPHCVKHWIFLFVFKIHFHMYGKSCYKIKSFCSDVKKNENTWCITRKMKKNVKKIKKKQKATFQPELNPTQTSTQNKHVSFDILSHEIYYENFLCAYKHHTS